jgi:predicted DNA-binding transcriptional regulator YafY
VNKTERTARLLMHLVQRRTLTTREAAELLDISHRLALADLKSLAKVAPVRFVQDGRRSRWVLDPEQQLGVLDRISLVVGREITGFLRGTSLHRGFDGVDAGNEALLARVRYVAEPERAYQAREDTVDACLDGLIRGRTLSFAYGDARTRVEGGWPLTLVVYRRALYLVLRLGRRPYLYAVDRMVDVVVGEPFPFPEDWDVDAWLSGRFGLTARDADEPEDVSLRFSAQVAHLVRARQWHPGQTLVDLADGQVLLTFRAKGMELARFVLEWGEHCEVLGPQTLRDRVVRELRNALARYEP